MHTMAAGIPWSTYNRTMCELVHRTPRPAPLPPPLPAPFVDLEPWQAEICW